MKLSDQIVKVVESSQNRQQNNQQRVIEQTQQVLNQLDKIGALKTPKYNVLPNPTSSRFMS